MDHLLQRQAFGNYGDMLRELPLNAFMAHFLDYDQNRPKSAECQHCAPNENFARELMQLFSLGVVKLAPHGTPLRDRRGRFIETYTQKDVEELARALPAGSTTPTRRTAAAQLRQLDQAHGASRCPTPAC